MSAERPLETDFYLLGRFLRADYLFLSAKAYAMPLTRKNYFASVAVIVWIQRTDNLLVTRH